MQRPFYFGILRHLKSGALNATEFTLGTKQNKSFFSVVDIVSTGVEHRSRRFWQRHFFDGILTFWIFGEGVSRRVFFLDIWTAPAVLFLANVGQRSHIIARVWK